MADEAGQSPDLIAAPISAAGMAVFSVAGMDLSAAMITVLGNFN